MPVVSGLLEGRRHEVVLGLPLGAVIRQLLKPPVHRRQFAVLAGARDRVDEDGATDDAQGDVEPILSQIVSPSSVPPPKVPMAALERVGDILRETPRPCGGLRGDRGSSRRT